MLPGFDFRTKKWLEFVFDAVHDLILNTPIYQLRMKQKKMAKKAEKKNPQNLPPMVSTEYTIVSIGCYAMLVCRVVGGLCRVVVGDTQVELLRMAVKEVADYLGETNITLET